MSQNCNYYIFKKLQISNLGFYILVPGDGGSQVEAKLNKDYVVHYICEKKTDYFFNIWLNMELLVPVVIDCWVSENEVQNKS